MKYKIIFGTDITFKRDDAEWKPCALEEKVQEMLDEGWKLLGVPFRTGNLYLVDEYSSQKTYQLAQAMILEEKELNDETNSKSR